MIVDLFLMVDLIFKIYIKNYAKVIDGTNKLQRFL